VRVVLDTNVLISALLSAHGSPALVLDAWRDGRFELVTGQEQIVELKRAAGYEKLRRYIPRAALGRLVTALRNAEILLVRLPRVGASPDPGDDYLLAMAISTDADFLVTGDNPLLALKRICTTRIVAPGRFAKLLRD
jgi:hypothetical protein